MCRASRIGTPLATRVPRVRMVRAMMFFSTSWPKMGTFNANMSQPIRPAENFRTSLMNSQMPIGTVGSKYHHFMVNWEALMRASVTAGSLASKSLKIFWNCGTIFDHDEGQNGRPRTRPR